MCVRVVGVCVVLCNSKNKDSKSIDSSHLEIFFTRLVLVNVKIGEG